MQRRKASIKETGEQLTEAEWARFDAATAAIKAERREDTQVRASGLIPSGASDRGSAGARKL